MTDLIQPQSGTVTTPDPQAIIQKKLPNNEAASVYCFFCGFQVGPAKKTSEIPHMCSKANVKRFRNPAYSQERWTCKPCRDKHRHDFDDIPLDNSKQ